MPAFDSTADYLVSNELRNAVNISVALGRPLLIKGEPGTGKTMLAKAIADSLGLSLIIWNIKSTTKAQEGLYVYDTVQRLYDSQFGDQDVSEIKQYIKLGKLGEAFVSDEQLVLLIDEIDKADLEFPNDLLWELDIMNFYIPETKETIQARQRPAVVITSNAEKELPDAFLRRCIFHYIDFPDEEMMARIVRVHFPDLEKALLEEALAAFYWLRSVNGLQKKPSTSELLDWTQALVVGGISYQRICAEIPFLGVLLKKNQDFELVLRRLQSGGLQQKATSIHTRRGY
ncbi:MAG TPA: MoxR family ATPase [Desulfotomaculum sp.]|jgi:MoxR-like ATPase|nr:MoxR family ATPase [Desulfotomaculum sp.]